jgi:hypothetical protein
MELLLNKQQYQNYLKQLKQCRDKGGEKGAECAERTTLQYLRQVPGMKDRVYPWLNYDWEYDIYTDNQYNKNKTGATSAGTFSALFKNPIAFKKLINGFLFDANPNKKSKAGVSDIPKCYGDKGCQMLNQIRKTYTNQSIPYPDPFFEKKLDGEMSSSYYIQTGTCPRLTLNKNECLNKGYQWKENPLYKMTPSFLRPPSFLDGSCYQPRYSYIKNQSGIQLEIPKSKNKKTNLGIDEINKNLHKMKGILPSFTNDILSLSPNNIYNAVNQEETPYIVNMKCPEHFCNYSQEYIISGKLKFIILFSCLILTFIIIMYI